MSQPILNCPPSAHNWWSQLLPYQRLVFIAATLAWLFDCLDQQLFNLGRSPAMTQLLEAGQDPKFFGGLATSIFVLGWATGGLIFGSLGDRYGRARMLAVTVGCYSVATGLSALSLHFTDFAIYRFITGLGVGGVFGLSVALVADTVPNHIRPRALGTLQALSAFGNGAAGFIGLGIALNDLGPSYWRWLFLFGAAPAILTVIIQARVKEPDAWVRSLNRALAEGRKPGSYRELFGHAKWRRHAVLGTLLCCAGIIGLWGIGVFSNDLVGDIIARNLQEQGMTAAEVLKGKQTWMALNLLLFNVGTFFGLMVFTRVTERLGRRKAFAIFFTSAMLVTIYVFQNLNGINDILWMAPLMGFCQLSIFAGFTIYLPELFPTRLRSTGVSFCYSAGRYLAATGPFTLGVLAAHLARRAEAIAMSTAGPNTSVQAFGIIRTTARIDAFRDAASIMCVIFLLGLVVLPFLPETKGQPLPED